nr:hypothetical protein Q903MT_gene1438 [Picea sitchensis]
MGPPKEYHDREAQHDHDIAITITEPQEYHNREAEDRKMDRLIRWMG